MASVKLTGLTKEQANAICIDTENNDYDLIEYLNVIFRKYKLEELDEYRDIIFDDTNFEPDNEIQL